MEKEIKKESKYLIKKIHAEISGASLKLHLDTSGILI